MTMTDALATFCNATALNTGGAGSYTIGSQIDPQQVTHNLGIGQPVYLVGKVATTATSGGSATATFILVTDDDVALTSGTVLATSATIAVASLTAGRGIFALALPSGTYLRYLGVQQITATAAFTAGAVTMFLTTDLDVYRAYANAI